MFKNPFVSVSWEWFAQAYQANQRPKPNLLTPVSLSPATSPRVVIAAYLDIGHSEYCCQILVKKTKHLWQMFCPWHDILQIGIISENPGLVYG